MPIGAGTGAGKGAGGGKGTGTGTGGGKGWGGTGTGCGTGWGGTGVVRCKAKSSEPITFHCKPTMLRKTINMTIHGINTGITETKSLTVNLLQPC